MAAARLRILRRRWLVGTAGVLAGCLAVGGLVATEPQPPEHEVAGDAGVWVVNRTLASLGRYDTAVDELNTVVGDDAAGPDTSVVQSGTIVLAVDPRARTVQRVDPAAARAVGSASLPEGAVVTIAGDDAAIVSGDGGFWTVPAGALGSFDPHAPPLVELGARSVVTGTPAGGVLAVSPTLGEVRVAEPGRSLGDAARVPITLDRGVVPQVVGTLTAWAVLSPGSAMLHTSMGDIDLTGVLGAGDGAVLQATADMPRVAPPATTDPGSVYLSTRSSLVRVDLRTQTVSTLSSGHSGTPVRPVEVDGCVYAAWSDGSMWRSCDGSPGVVAVSARSGRSGTLVGLERGARPVFQVNADRVVLNDPASGTIWAVQTDNRAVSNWAELIEPPGGTVLAAGGDDPAAPSVAPEGPVQTTGPVAPRPTPSPTPRPVAPVDAPSSPPDDSGAAAQPAPVVVDPPTPTNVSVSVTDAPGGSATAALSWSPFGGAVGYFLQSLGPGGTSGAVPCTVGSAGPVAPVGGTVSALGDVSEARVSGLLPAPGAYGFLVWGFNAWGCAASALVTVTVEQPPHPLTITAVDGQMIDSGTDYDYQITGIAPAAGWYELQRLESGSPVGGVARVLGAGVIPRTVTGGPFGELYEYRLRACEGEPSTDAPPVAGSPADPCGPWSRQLAPEPSVTLAVEQVHYDSAAGAWSFLLPDNGALRARVVCGSDSGTTGDFAASPVGCSTTVPAAVDDAFLSIAIGGRSRVFRP
ncbi:hypothetical protein [Herbiconiux liangxiaofengii]|uniref:hypothetical protein n=1 Tax=Herbiconiux liangxiaofengii TaxID=3342795 RepID=UPI0035B7DA32